MTSVPLTDVFLRFPISKFTFGVPFTTLLAAPIFTAIMLFFGIEIQAFEAFVNTNPQISFGVMFICVLPFMIIAGYTYERWIRPMIRSKGLSEDGFLTSLLILVISFTLFVFIPVGVLILIGVATA